MEWVGDDDGCHEANREARLMCAQCVAQGAPMVAAGLTVLRRRTIMAWLRARFSRTVHARPISNRATTHRGDLPRATVTTLADDRGN